MTKRGILVAPLDWGLGHATRCVPLIRALLEQQNEVIITANGRAQHYLKQEFPDLEFVSSPAYNVRYSNTIPLWLMILFQSPRILWNIYKEHKWLSQFIDNKKIDEVISDNRYGMWSGKKRCVFITHQVMIKCPVAINFLEPLLHKIVKWFMNKYTECWIPDIEGDGNLSGELSHKYKLPGNTKYIGWLSRFNSKQQEDLKNDSEDQKDDRYSLCFILSGPEPQRSELENKIRSQQSSISKKAILIQGKPEHKKREMLGENLLIISHLGQTDLEKVIQKSDLIVCRAGYSSIMDLKVLGKTAVLIPTPGQTEQEYLADYLSGKGEFIKMNQDDFRIGFFESDTPKMMHQANPIKSNERNINEYSE